MMLENLPPEDALQLFAGADSEAPERAARFLKSLAHRDRLKLLCCLIDAEVPVAQLESRVGASQSAVSQHLALMRDEGVLKARRDGRQVFYSIADPMVLSLVKLLYERFCEPGPQPALLGRP